MAKRYKKVQVITSEPISVADYVHMSSTTPLIGLIARLLQILANRNIVNALELSYILTGKPDHSIKYD